MSFALNLCGFFFRSEEFSNRYQEIIDNLMSNNLNLCSTMKAKKSWVMAMSECLETDNKRKTELRELCALTETHDVDAVTSPENDVIQRL